MDSLATLGKLNAVLRCGPGRACRPGSSDWGVEQIVGLFLNQSVPQPGAVAGDPGDATDRCGHGRVKQTVVGHLAGQGDQVKSDHFRDGSLARLSRLRDTQDDASTESEIVLHIGGGVGELGADPVCLDRPHREVPS